MNELITIRLSQCNHMCYCIKCFFLLIVISAEVMDTANLSNVVFPASPGNFSQELNETVKIEIPAKPLRLLSAGDEGAGKHCVVN